MAGNDTDSGQATPSSRSIVDRPEDDIDIDKAVRLDVYHRHRAEILAEKRARQRQQPTRKQPVEKVESATLFDEEVDG